MAIEFAEEVEVSVNSGEPVVLTGEQMEQIRRSTEFSETKKVSIEFILTDTEKAERAIAAAVIEEEIRAQENILADLKIQEKSIKGAIEEKLGDVRRDLRAIKRGTEMRDIECGVVNDFATNRVGYISIESGECMKVRPMTAEERQRQMKLEEPPAPEPSARHLELLDEWEEASGAIGAQNDDRDEDGDEAAAS